MAYLRGNSVVDGNLYVEGALLVKEVRPEGDEGAILAKIGGTEGQVVGRHLRIEDTDVGTLNDSSIVETVVETTVDNDTTVTANIFVDRRNDAGFGNNYPPASSDVDELIINYPVERTYIVKKALTPVMPQEGNFDAVNNPGKIVSWSY